MKEEIKNIEKQIGYMKGLYENIETEQKDAYKILGKINNQIEAFRKMYHKKPTFIIISEKLEYILRNQMELMCQNEMIILNDEALNLNRIL